MMPKQTLDVGDYFQYDEIHPGGYYKVEAKFGNIYFVWSNQRLENGTCHSLFGECPFAEDNPEVPKKCMQDHSKDPKIEIPGKPNYGGNHYTCMMINPDKVKKICKLEGLLAIEH